MIRLATNAFIIPSALRPLHHITVASNQQLCPHTRHNRTLTLSSAQPSKPTSIPEETSTPIKTPSTPKPKPRGDRLLLVGLGNPGPNYANTRHNIGFELVDEFAKRNGNPPFKNDKRFHANVATLSVASRTVHVVKPRTFMNDSGRAVRAIMSFYKVSPEALMVVADDMALELGRTRLRGKGSAGGHNGLKSVEKHVGTQQYARLKVGVGSPRGGGEAWKDHVLGGFSRGEQDMLIDVTWDCMDVLEHWVREQDLGKVMNKMGIAQQSRGKKG